MRVLFYRYNSICEPDYISGFLSLGIEVAEITEEMTNKNITQAEVVGIVSTELKKGGVDFLFSINFYPAISATCQVFHIPYLCQTVDSPVFELYAEDLKNDCNHVFVFDMDQYKTFAPRNPGHVFHLPLATNTSRWDEVIANTSAEDKERFSCDVSFVGSLYTEKNPYDEFQGRGSYVEGFLDGVMNAQLKIYGFNFLSDILREDVVEGFKSLTPSFYSPSERFDVSDVEILARNYLDAEISVRERRDVMEQLGMRFSVDLFTRSATAGLPVNDRGGCQTMTEMPVIFNRSKINLNITTKGIRDGVSLRVFDVLGCGGFLITNYQSEISEIFVPGEDLEIYTSIEDLAEKVEYYLEHEDERKRIAQNGYKKVKEYHNHKVRIAQMLEMAFGV